MEYHQNEGRGNSKMENVNGNGKWTPSRIRNERLKRELSQLELAELLGVAEKTIRNMEHGRMPIKNMVGYALDYLWGSLEEDMLLTKRAVLFSKEEIFFIYHMLIDVKYYLKRIRLIEGDDTYERIENAVILILKKFGIDAYLNVKLIF